MPKLVPVILLVGALIFFAVAGYSVSKALSQKHTTKIICVEAK